MSGKQRSVLSQDIFDGHLLDGDKNRVVVKFEPTDFNLPKVDVLQVVGDGIELFITLINDVIKIAESLIYLLITLIKSLPAIGITALIIYSGQSKILLLPFGVLQEMLRLF